MRDRDASGTANVIALLVVIVLLVIVGHDALAPGQVAKSPRATAEAASRPAATAAKSSPLMEHAPASPFARGMEHARRSLTPLRH